MGYDFGFWVDNNNNNNIREETSLSKQTPKGKD